MVRVRIAAKRRYDHFHWLLAAPVNGSLFRPPRIVILTNRLNKIN